ncbi:MAG TPA: phytanoyl-CoA dioxygenase family protein [Myxococcota bacterium]|nr:phytanoyl-CoA dioxygenase family protein [Myxococcota bacterium]
MAASLQRLSARAPRESIGDALLRDGGVIVEEFLASAVVARIRSEVEAVRRAADPGMKHLNPAIQYFFGDKTRHVNGMAAQSRTFATEVLIHPIFLALCDRVLLPSCARYQLNLGHLIDRGPGSQAQMLHRDEDVWVHVPRPHAELQLASMIALEDFRAENGATRIVPGSHRWPRGRKPEPDEIADAEMPAGSAAIYLGSTIHGAGANSTANEWRPGLHISYTLGWLRTEENNYLAVPPEVARDLPRSAQEVLGYAVHDAIASAGGYLGMLGLRDPVDLMSEGKL